MLSVNCFRGFPAVCYPTVEDIRKALLEKAKPYTVSVYPWQKEALENRRALIPLCGGSILALQEGYYDPVIGLTEQQGDLPFQEV